MKQPVERKLGSRRGQCIDMPCETEEFREHMDVWHPAYPTTEYGGLVHLQVLARHRATLSNVRHHQYPHRDDVVLRGMRLWGD